jgi:spore maturation protein CgeB
MYRDQGYGDSRILPAAANDIDFVGAGGKVRYSRFLREIAGARLSLHVAGNGPFTHRITEFLGLGSCMISVRFPLALHVPLVPGVHYVTCADDLSDLVEVCRYYIRLDDDRERIAAAGCEYFDRYLHCDQLAGYYVTTILNRLGKR